MADIKAQLELQTRQFDSALARSQKNVQGFGASAKGVFGGIAAAFAAIQVGQFARDIVSTSSSFEQLRVSLETVTGSAKVANAAFAELQKFSDETPYTVGELADSFTKLAAYGLDPSIESLKSLGNTASALGKPLNQAVEALADAATGEFERLKEFGIKARSEGDRVAFTFRGVTTEVGKNAAEIQQYLLNIGNTQFAGAIEKQSTTLAGRLSTLTSVFQTQTDQILRNSGAYDFLKQIIDGLIETTRGLGSRFEGLSMAVTGFATSTVAAFTGMFLELVKFGKELDIVFVQIFNDIGIVFENFINKVIDGVNVAIEGLNNLPGVEIDLIPKFDGKGNFDDTIEELKGNIQEIDKYLVTNNRVFEQSVEKMSQGWKMLTGEVTVTKEAVGDTAATFKDFVTESRATADAARAVAENNKMVAKTLDEMGTEIDEIDKQFKDLDSSYQSWNSNLETTLDKLLPARKETREYYKDLKNLDEALAAGKISFDEYAEATFALEGGFEQAGEKTEKLKVGISSIDEAMQMLSESTQSWGDGLTKTVREGGSVLDHFGNKAASAFDKIADSFFNNALDQIFSGGGTSGGGGGGLLGGITSAIGSSVGNFFGGFFEKGGYLPAGKFGVVGEKGPEIITGPSQVTPMDGGMGGLSVGQVTNVFNVEAESFDTMWQTAARKNVDYLGALMRESDNKFGASGQRRSR